jgi:hypothetical protein
MLAARTARTRSVGTKLTEEEYGRLEALAAERGLTIGEWVREALLGIAGDGQPAAAGSPTEQALLAEVIALRTIVLNLVYDQASGEPLTPERMQELIAKADGDKRDKAIQRLQATARGAA